MKCLVVDAMEENLEIFNALLQRDDVEVLLARSGTDALELLLTHEVALALLDVQMPDMDGFELAELMRGSERTAHVPIIFITAGAHDQRRIFRLTREQGAGGLPGHALCDHCDAASLPSRSIAFSSGCVQERPQLRRM